MYYKTRKWCICSDVICIIVDFNTILTIVMFHYDRGLPTVLESPRSARLSSLPVLLHLIQFMKLVMVGRESFSSTSVGDLYIKTLVVLFVSTEYYPAGGVDQNRNRL